MAVYQPIKHSDPSISVVVPTIPTNSHEEVIKCLENQIFDRFEVFIVDDAELDICEARNEGIQRAEGKIVALTDDDCRPPNEWLSNIWKAFEQRSNLVCLEGSVYGGRAYNGERRYVGCNLAFDRETALAVGGFSSEFAGWRDDTEFGWRMERDSNGSCIYKGNVRMSHPKQPRAKIDDELEARLQKEYPIRYDQILVPDTFVGRINDWLWRKGLWDAVSSFQHTK